jgi:two-component sensor histidine kinase
VIPLQLSALTKLAKGERADDVLRDICTHVEKKLPGSIVGVTILDRASRVFEKALFPSIAQAYSDALRGAVVAEKVGSCALAVYKNEPVFSDDIENDARFQDGWKQLGRAHGMRSIQSHPVADQGTALGTFVIAFAEPRALTAEEQEIVSIAIELASVALLRRKADDQRELVIGELQHRIRNAFATVGALVYSTLRTYPDTKEFRTVFDGRLQALSRAHSLVLKEWDADLRGLLNDALAPYTNTHRIEISGPALTLTPDAAVAFSLAVHELATNANKYGSFSKADGALKVDWNIAGESGVETFEMVWRESGVPILAKPTRKGFGSATIERSFANIVEGQVSLDFAETGLVCTIRAPLTTRFGSRPN